MPLVGWQCKTDGAEHRFEDCLFCVRPCLPLPLLLKLSRGERKTEPGVYHVTEILNPPKVNYFKRHYDYYEDPLDSAYTTFGTSFHSIMEEGAVLVKEMGLGDHLRVEEPFSVELDTPAGKATLRGRPDIFDARLRTLYDYKTAKAYPAVKMKKGEWQDSNYMPQLNIYRHFAYPEAEHLVLVLMIKDHGRQVQIRDGLRPIEVIEVPILAPAAVQEYVIYRVAENLRAEKDPMSVRECLGDELWTQRDGMPMRCMDYCSAGKAKMCLQGCTLIDAYQKSQKRKNRS